MHLKHNDNLFTPVAYVSGVVIYQKTNTVIIIIRRTSPLDAPNDYIFVKYCSERKSQIY